MRTSSRLVLLILMGTASCSVSTRQTAVDAAVAQPNPDLATTDSAIDDPNCHEQQFSPQTMGEPDILILMDTSFSMTDGKYEQMRDAVTTVLADLTQAGSAIQWGLVFFPEKGGNDCDVAAAPDVPMAPVTSLDGGITWEIKHAQLHGNTPMEKAVKLAVDYYTQQLVDGRGHYILIATDGEPNCDECLQASDCATGQSCMLTTCMGGNGTTRTSMAIAEALTLHNIPTYVIGIDTGGSKALDQMAVSGGTAKSSSPKYYQVTNTVELSTALDSITQTIMSCYFALDMLPPSYDHVTVKVAGNVIPRDTTHGNGWDIFSPSKTLTLYGDACTQLQAHPGTVEVDYQCPPPPPL